MSNPFEVVNNFGQGAKDLEDYQFELERDKRKIIMIAQRISKLRVDMRDFFEIDKDVRDALYMVGSFNYEIDRILDYNKKQANEYYFQGFIKEADAKKMRLWEVFKKMIPEIIKEELGDIGSLEGLKNNELRKALVSINYIYNILESNSLVRYKGIQLNEISAYRKLQELQTELEQRIRNSYHDDIEAIKTGELNGKKLLEKFKNTSREEYDGISLNNYLHELFKLDRNASLKVDEIRDNDMCFYQPTPADYILHLVEDLKLNKEDIVYDLGSGRGVVVNLLALLSDAKVKGIEWANEYADDANRVSNELQIENAQTIQGDVRDIDFSDGNVFYLFNPFFGEILNDVIKRLEELSKTKKIRICTLANTHAFNHLPWLRRSEQSSGRGVDIFESV